jgi:hypothetical protein
VLLRNGSSTTIRHNKQIHISYKITHHAQSRAYKDTQTINRMSTKQKERKEKRK